MMRRVLIVEDDADTLEMLSLWLHRWGYACDEALSGEDALRLVSEHCPDVIISDLVMPGMSGLDLLKAIRTQNLECRSVFVLISGHTSVEVAVSAIEEGADECLLKPIEPEALRTLLLKIETKATESRQ